ncbi:MAG: glycine--tRNA ligase [Flavobacteriales bacterium]|jgi:glycyl-tRNA synthetase|nr:glycine--tRNA ligase [Flavobacteriales bacterium]
MIDLKKIISHSKEYGFVFPSSEIYDGLSATYDYGPFGVELKNNIKKHWWQSMVYEHENIVGLDSAIFMHPLIWKASGHVDAFNDPLVDNKDSKKRYRADALIEDQLVKFQQKINKEIKKGEKRFGSKFEIVTFQKTNARILKYNDKIKNSKEKLNAALEKSDMNALNELISDLEIRCPVSGTSNWTEVRTFNLMFDTQLGAVADESNKLYLRPETAQGIFVNFLNVQKSARKKIPFGIAQIGKAFRNEIVARQFIFRMREFEQMEMQFFVKPGQEIEWYQFWKQSRMEWHKSLNLCQGNYKFHDHSNLAHYANAACDIEYEFPIGFKELEGIHSRTNYDLSQHQNYSKKKLSYFDSESNESYLPYVVETSVGLDRLFLSVLCGSFAEETVNNEKRTVLKLPNYLAPISVAILPLLKKDGLDDYARNLFNDLKIKFPCHYEDKDSIGKRYRRQDAIGTPLCITIDHDTLIDKKITIRDRDTMLQERVSISNLSDLIKERIGS